VLYYQTCKKETDTFARLEVFTVVKIQVKGLMGCGNM